MRELKHQQIQRDLDRVDETRLRAAARSIKTPAELEAILDACDPPVAPEIRADVKARILAVAPHLRVM